MVRQSAPWLTSRCTTSLEQDRYWFSTVLQTSSVVNDDPLPPNLSFDRRSSFAPAPEPVLKPSSIVEEETDGDTAEDLEEDDGGDATDDEEEEIDVENLSSPQYVIPLPDRLKTNVHYGLDGSVSGTLWLESSVFGVDPIRIDLIKQAVDYIRNKVRGRRKAKSKTISEVSGSGRKVRQQKGSGKARAGHSRPAHWRGGAKAHGPKNTTDYGNVKMNKKAKRLAMASTLSQKLKEGNLILVDSLALESHKTSSWAKVLEDSFGVGKSAASALIVDHYHDSVGNEENKTSQESFNGVPINLWVASSNIARVKVVNQSFANVYDIMKKEKLIITLGALELMERRLKQ